MPEISDQLITMLKEMVAENRKEHKELWDSISRLKESQSVSNLKITGIVAFATFLGTWFFQAVIVPALKIGIKP